MWTIGLYSFTSKIAIGNVFVLEDRLERSDCIFDDFFHILEDGADGAGAHHVAFCVLVEA